MERNPNPDMEMKKKIIALAALPLSVGFLVWRMQSNTQAAPPPEPPAVVAMVETTPAASPMTTAGLRQVVAVPVSTRDPFIPQMNTKPNEQRTESASEASGQAAPALQIPAGPPPNLAPLPALTVDGGGLHAFAPTGPGMALPPLMPSEPSAPAEPAEPAKPVMPYHLSGVLKGAPDLAILRHSDGTRLLVRLGDMVDEEFRLVMVSENSARLSSTGSNHTLYVGGETAPQPKGLPVTGGLQARLAAAAIALKH